MPASFNLLQELFHLRVRSKIDTRTTASELTLVQDGRKVTVRGFSHYRQTDAFIRKVAAEIFQGYDLTFDLKALHGRGTLKFAECTVVSAPFYKQPQVVKEDLLTEALLGTVMRVYFERNGFLFAQHPDGYVGYVRKQDLKPVGVERYLRWKNGTCAVARIAVKLGEITISPASKLIHEDGRVQLPDESWHRIRRGDFMVVPKDTDGFVKSILQHANAFASTPYLWGGKTVSGIDCSGFVQSLVLQERIRLPRDASMQAHVGEIVGYLPNREDLMPGDVLFFMNKDAHVFHVGIYLGNQEYLHSSGTKNVVRSSLVPGGKNYLSRYGTTFVYARRMQL